MFFDVVEVLFLKFQFSILFQFSIFKMAEKLVLVDKDLLLKMLGKLQTPNAPPTNPTLREINHLDSELATTTLDTTMAEPLRVKKINNLIAKHNIQQEHFESGPASPVTQPAAQPEDAWAKKTLSLIPQKSQRITRSLLEHIKSSGRLDWDEAGRLVKDGTRVQDSNILDLVHGVTRTRKIAPPPGSAEFVDMLHQINTPLELIPNAKALVESALLPPPLKLSFVTPRKSMVTPGKPFVAGRKSFMTPRKAAFKRGLSSPMPRATPSKKPKTKFASLPPVKLPPGWEHME